MINAKYCGGCGREWLFDSRWARYWHYCAVLCRDWYMTPTEYRQRYPDD